MNIVLSISQAIPSLTGTVAVGEMGRTPLLLSLIGNVLPLPSVRGSTSLGMNLPQMMSNNSRAVESGVGTLGLGETPGFLSSEGVDGEEVRTSPGIIHGIHRNEDVEKESRHMQRWIANMLDERMEDEIFPSIEHMKEEVDKVWGKGKGKDL